MKTIVIIALVLSIVAATLVGWVVYSSPSASAKVCIVQMSVIMDRYEGAMDASATLQRKQSAMQMNVDSLIRTVDVNSTDQVSNVRKEQLQQYIRAVEQKATEEQAALSKRLLSHIRTASETVAEQQGLDLIFAITDESFVLSKREAVDVTEEVLRELKHTYRHEFKN